MKRSHIIILAGIAALIVGLISYAADFSTYDSIRSAQGKPGKPVTIIAKLDKNYPSEFDAIKDPNYFSFHAVDSLGGETRVVFHNSKPTDFEKSERLVMKGKMTGDHFECSSILLKCPSKYKDDEKYLGKNVQEQTSAD